MADTVPAVTGLYAGILALILLAIAAWVGRRRIVTGIGVGDGGDDELRRRMRVNANFVEYVPLALVLMMLLELTGAAGWFLHALGTVLVLSRLIHVPGVGPLEGRRRGFRIVGTFGTWAVLATAGLVLIGRFVPI